MKESKKFTKRNPLKNSETSEIYKSQKIKKSNNATINPTENPKILKTNPEIQKKAPAIYKKNHP